MSNGAYDISGNFEVNIINDHKNLTKIINYIFSFEIPVTFYLITTM